MEVLIGLLIAVVVYFVAGLIVPAPWPLVLAIVAALVYVFGMPQLRR